MSTSLRILFVEDSEDDTLLLLRELKRGGFDPVYERVDTPADMVLALDKYDWDIVISDYVMPRFSGLDALRLLRERGMDLPFIMVSGKIGEDTAVEAMHAGAHDYIVKANLARFIPAVNRGLSEASLRQKRKQAEDALKKSQVNLATAQRIAHLGSWELDIITNQLFWSDEVYRIFGLPIESNPTYASFLDAVHPADREYVKSSMNAALYENKNYNIDYRIILPNATERIISEQAEVLFDNNRAFQMIGTVQDITDRKLVEEKLRTATQQLTDIIEFLPDATFVIDKDKKVIAWNKAIEKMTGVPKKDIVGKGDYAYAFYFYGQVRPILIDFIFLNDKEYEKSYHLFEKEGNKIYGENFVPSLYEGKGAFLIATASPLFDHNGKIAGAIETIRDVTRRKRIEEKLQFLANNDPLTNIANRYSLEERLKSAVLKAKIGIISALLFIDLDNFKLVNDTLGHAAGDDLLVSLTNLLKNNLNKCDFLARFGGDEFAVILEGVNAATALVVAEKLRLAVDEEEVCLIAYKHCFNLTVSIGVILIDGTLDEQKLLSRADTALCAAKEGGRNRAVLVKPDEDSTVTKLSETNQIISLIKNALKENLFVLYYQPIYSIDDGIIIHHEALVRLRTNNGELILPNRFIPVAERFGIMPQIDRWVVRTSIDALLNNDDLKLFINISGVSLGDEELLDFIETSIVNSGIEPSRIGFEITETAAVKDLTWAEHWFRKLKKIGCRFALDDFGIGFSSFSYLRIIPADYLKLDGFFIRDLDKDPTHYALVQSMNNIAHTLGKKTVAEFVENAGLLKVLRELGIDYGQGYYLGKPKATPTRGDNT